MAHFRTSLVSAMSMGKRMYDPIFTVASKSHLPDKTYSVVNMTDQNVYRKMLEDDHEPIPKMHSIYIPDYLRFKRMQREAAIDDGRRLYEKWAIDRVEYRTIWYLTIVIFSLQAFNVGILVYEHA